MWKKKIFFHKIFFRIIQNRITIDGYNGLSNCYGLYEKYIISCFLMHKEKLCCTVFILRYIIRFFLCLSEKELLHNRMTKKI
jgi:hypothetical protein